MKVSEKASSAGTGKIATKEKRREDQNFTQSQPKTRWKGDHGSFDDSKRTASPLMVLKSIEADRITKLTALKHRKMMQSSFAYFRGTAAVMAADLSVHPHTGLYTQICGDAHVLNLGAYANPEGGLVFDINDFDESLRAPFEWDLKRMATSLLLAGEILGMGRTAQEEAVLVFMRRYRRSMRQFASMPMLQLARYQVHRFSQIEPIKSILNTAERSTPPKLLAKLTETHHEGRRFRSNPPLLTRLKRSEQEDVLRLLEFYKTTLQPERRFFLERYQPVDIALKVVGTGSIGLRTYCVYLRSVSELGDRDPLFLQIKEERPSVYAPYVTTPHSMTTRNEGQRVLNGQRAMQLSSDPLLGFARGCGRDYLVRQLNDHKASLDLYALSEAHLLAYAKVAAELFAKGHARSGDPAALADCVGKSDRFDRALLKFGKDYATVVDNDWREFRRVASGRRSSTRRSAA